MSALPSLVQRADLFFSALVAHLPPPLNDPRVRFRLQAGAAIALIATFLTILLLFSYLLAPLDRLSTDLLYHAMPPDSNLALIAIDKRSLDEIGTFPWSRQIYAQLLERLTVAPPRVIAFDIGMSAPSPQDDVLGSAIRKSGNVVLAVTADDSAALPLQSDTPPAYSRVNLPAPFLLPFAKRVGHRIVIPDPDQITRRVPTVIQSGSSQYPTLGLVAVAAYLNLPEIQARVPARVTTLGKYRIPTDELGNMLVNFTGPHADIATYSFIDVLRGTVPAKTFADKLVFVGGNSTIESEQYTLPLQLDEARTYNVNLQADIANMLISSPPLTLQSLGALGQLGLILALALLAGLTLPHLRLLYAVALTLLYLAAFLLYAFDTFNRGLVIQIFFPALALILTGSSIITFRYFSEDRRRQFLTSFFRRYVPAEIVGRVIDAIDRGELPLTGTRRMVTVLYADLRGFASISDEIKPEAVLQTVNRYMELALQAISRQGGTVSKPMGDALIAIWNAPLDQNNHCARGLQAAVEIRRNFIQYQKQDEQQEKFSVGIGLATGWAVMGNISALGKVEYTLVGDTVNVAARISAFANNNQILADTATAQPPPKDIVVRELSPVRVRGRKEPLPVWEVRESGPAPSAQDQDE